MTGLRVIKPGVFTTIQDWGRYGQRENGLSTGGPLDEHAFLWANQLLGNNSQATTIEITVGLCGFISTINTTISICGADMDLQINNRPARNWSTHHIKANDELIFRSARFGLRAYLAIKGGFNVQPVFGSTSTVARESLGGLSGKPLEYDDLIQATRHGDKQLQRAVSSQFIPEYKNKTTLKFIPSYQYNRFESSQQKTFINHSFTVSQRIDRMGYRLEGKKITYGGRGITSEGIALGSIQIPPDGQPIILLKDSGTIGGYPKLGCVARMDLNKLAQCRTGDKVNFEVADFSLMLEKLNNFYRFFGLS